MNLSQPSLVEHLSAAHHFQKRLSEQWFFGIEDWVPLTQSKLQALLPLTQADARPRILLDLQNPSDFLAAFMAACLTESPVFLGNPHWSHADGESAIATSQPHIIWSDTDRPSTQPPVSTSQKGWIMIPTGGSSGQIRFAIHTWSTLMASVQACQKYFETPTINSCCALPLYHVSGLMQFLRSLTTGGQFNLLSFTDLLNGTSTHPALAAFVNSKSQQPQDFFLSLVPTQLQRLLQKPDRIPWLARFHTVLLGGAPAWPELLDIARKHKIRLAPTYGMTETASQVVTLKPDDFLQGNHSSGQVLPHAQITIQDNAPQPLPISKTGRITIQAKSLCLGYYPERFTNPGTFVTDDLGYFSEGREDLYLVGRHSRKIISGGENIFPEELEAAIRATGLVTDIYVTGIPDAEWGEVAIALYIPTTSQASGTKIQAALQKTLSKFKYPKHWIMVSKLPRNHQGKVSQIQVKEMVRSHFEARTTGNS